MKLRTSILVFLCTALSVSISVAQEKVTKEQWQQEMKQGTKERDALKIELAKLTREIDSLKSVVAALDKKTSSVKSETFALVNSSEANVRSFETALSKVEALINQLSLLSSQDLYLRKSDVDVAQTEKDSLSKQRLAAIQKYHDRLESLQSKIGSLRSTLAAIASSAEKIYVVGSWSENRDCLWNIAKKKTIYANPFMWPKIWQDNRDKIKDPDLIYKGEKLNIPQAGSLTSNDKIALRHYWQKHSHS